MDPVVSVKQGKIRGAVSQLFDGSLYYSFKGIPYAQVPARFLTSIPVEPWQGIYNATKHGPKCPQYDMTKGKYVKGDENCLYLNIYTKSIKPDAKLPVMVFIHGGAYMSGSGNVEDGLGPDLLIQHNVILVTFNYRLEVLGFLCLDIPEVPGNAGMKDQVQALKWVKDNIETFGGDPNNITLFGVSAGAASVTFHIQSPMSKGLFNKAIAQSGLSIAGWAQGQNGKERAFRAAKYLGKNTTNNSELLHFLKSVPVEKLAKLKIKTETIEEKHKGFPIYFAPVVEKKFDHVEGFLYEEPIDFLISSKIPNNIPLMLGYNSNESLLMLNDVLKNIGVMNKNLRYFVPMEIALKVSEEKTIELGEKIRKFYVNDREFAKDDFKIISDMLSDIHFVYNSHRYAYFYSKQSPTYLYKFCCDTELNLMKHNSRFRHMKGACHTDEIFYLFYSNINKGIIE